MPRDERAGDGVGPHAEDDEAVVRHGAERVDDDGPGTLTIEPGAVGECRARGSWWPAALVRSAARPAARTPLVGVTAGPVPSCGQTVGDPALQGTLALRAAPLTVSANGPGLVSYDTKLVNGTSTSLAGVLGPVESVVVRDGIVVAAFDGGRQVGQVIDLTPGREGVAWIAVGMGAFEFGDDGLEPLDPRPSDSGRVWLGS